MYCGLSSDYVNFVNIAFFHLLVFMYYATTNIQMLMWGSFFRRCHWPFLWLEPRRWIARDEKQCPHWMHVTQCYNAQCTTHRYMYCKHSL